MTSTANQDERPIQPVRMRHWHWRIFKPLCQVWMAVSYRFRAWGLERIPRQGGVLFLANHQSFLDPILVGVHGRAPRFFAMARSTLFHHRLVGWLIRGLNAIPVERGGSDPGALRRGIEVLAAGYPLLIFPEGTRTRDGSTGEFERGFLLLVRRAKPVIVPVAIEGAYAAWPKGRPRPRAFGRIGVEYGEPIPAETVLAMDADQACRMLRDRVEALRLQVARRLAEAAPRR